MESWDDLARQAYAATDDLYTREHWRSAISRAYYAVYACAVDTFLQSGLTLPARGNPKHEDVPIMVLHNLVGMNWSRRANIASAIEKLYKLRIVADYYPAGRVDRGTTFVATGLMTQVFRELKEGAGQV